jgi:hypothetical protein
LKSLLPAACTAAESALTQGAKPHILCLIAVPGTNSGPKRESGANPELPRSGKWERTMPLALNRLTSQRLGKRHAVGTGLNTEPLARESEDLPRSSPREGGVVRLWSSRGRSDRNARVCASSADLIPSSFIAGSCCPGEQRTADGSDARVNRAIEPSVALLSGVERGVYVEGTWQ